MFRASSVVVALVALSPAWAADSPKMNVLFIAVDDLRPQLGCYGDKTVKSPNIDRLAKRGLVFDRAYCQQAVCSPSRTSLLTGRRPDTTKVYDLETHFRNTIPDVVTLPQYFKDNGYHAEGMGKIYHGGLDDEKSWSVKHWTPKGKNFGPEGQKLLQKLRDDAVKAGKDLTKRANQPRGFPWEAPDVADNYLNDGATADHAVERLRAVKDKPFFLAVGFVKPHLPFVAPKQYWDLYNEKDFELAKNSDPPKNAPAYALHNFGELRAYHGIPAKGPLSNDQALKMLHGYHACVSYMDAQVGKVLDELDRLKLADKTIVILWGDHGWQLGEHGLWCKHTNYETSARAAMLIAVPGQKSAGQKTNALTEYVDIYPTLAELCGLPRAKDLEGTSFKPLLDNPKRDWKKAAFSQYPRQIPGQGRCMGYSIRTNRYRLVRWANSEKNFEEYELYDHQTDPGENVNVAKKADYSEIVKELAGQLKAGWNEAVPPK